MLPCGRERMGIGVEGRAIQVERMAATKAKAQKSTGYYIERNTNLAGNA